METEKRDPPISQFKSEVGVMRWNDASKTKSVKFVSMLSTIHTFEMVDSNTDQLVQSFKSQMLLWTTMSRWAVLI